MSAPDEIFELANLRGNVDVPLFSYPTIRGTVRRSDPDGSHSQPFFPGLAGTSLQVITGTVGGGPPTTTTINFATNNYADAVAAVNAAAPTEIAWSEADGFASIRSVHQGGKNLVAAYLGTAAPILGFTLYPAPGSTSIAGDIATAPGDKNQHNPQGTVLLAHGENITTSTINRALLGILQGARQRLNDLDKEIVIYNLVLATQYSSLGAFASNTLKLPGNTVVRASIQALVGLGAGIDEAVAVLDSVNKRPMYTSNALIKVTDVTYGPADQGVSHGSSIVWGTPGLGGVNGVFIGQSNVAKSLKVPATNITSILGGQLKATGALFVTKKVMQDDHIKISSSTNSVPFDHNGEYAVVAVLDEDTITIRPLGFNELKVDSNNDVPNYLNPVLGPGQNYGQVSVYVGNGMRSIGPSGAPEDGIFIQTNGSFTVGQQAYVKIPVVTTLRKLAASSLLPHPRWDSDVPLNDWTNLFTKQNSYKEGIKLKATTQVSGTPVARIQADMDDGATDAGYMLLSESLNANDIPVRLYQTRSSANLFFTMNAKFDGPSGSWIQDNAGLASTRYDFTKSGFLVKRFEAGTAPGVVTSDNWPETLFKLNSVSIKSLGAQNPGLFNTARLETPTGGNFTFDDYVLLWSFTGVDTGGGNIIVTRLYMRAAHGGLVITMNARWDGANWNKDAAGFPAIRTGLDKGLQMESRQGTSNAAWNDAAWDGTLSAFFNISNLTAGGSLPNLFTLKGPIRWWNPDVAAGDPFVTDKALALFGDRAGNFHSKIDHCGYPIHSGMNRLEHGWWKDIGSAQSSSPVITFPEIKFVRIGTGTYSYVAPSSSYPAPQAQIDFSTTVSDDAFIVFPVMILLNAASSFVLEWDAFVQNPLDKFNVQMGMTDSANGFRTGFNVNARFTYQAFSGPNLNVYTDGGSTAVLTETFSDWHTYRIEIHGSATAYGTNTVKFARDGVNAGVLQGGLAGGVIGAALRFAFGADCNNGAVPTKQMRVGNIRALWNNYGTII